MPRRIKRERILKFIPTPAQRNKIIPEWKTATPEARALLRTLSNKKVSVAFRRKHARTLAKLPPKRELMLIPEKFPLTDLRRLDKILCRIICRRRRVYRVRKNQASLSPEEWRRFICAIDALMASDAPVPTYQEFVDIHVQAMTHAGMSWGAHGHSNFLPWHREYLLLVEDRLRAINPLVTIPYWNWVEDRAIPPQLSDPQDLARWGVTRAPSFLEPLPTQTQLDNVMAQTTYADLRLNLETGPHNAVHRAVGGTMRTSGSPGDPLFWLHHGFVDKIWADWQKINTSTPTNLTEQLQPSPFFTRTVGQVLNTRSLGYVYL
jgi:tyrosinase